MAVSGLMAPGVSAQQVVPGNDPRCPIVNNTATCEGDLSDGIISQASDASFDVLVVENAAGDIAPSGTAGITVSRNSDNFRADIADDIVIVTRDDQGIAGAAHGISLSTANASIELNNAADITSDGVDQSIAGSQVVVSGNGNIAITNQGDIAAQSDAQFANGIYALVEGAGAVTINNSGAVTAVSRSTGEREINASALFAGTQAGGNITVENTGQLSVQATPNNIDTDFNGVVGGIVTSASGASATTRIRHTGSDASIVASGILGDATQVNGIVAIQSNNDDGQGVLAIETGADTQILASGNQSFGILARALGNDILVDLAIAGDITTDMANGAGIFVAADAAENRVSLVNAGDLTDGPDATISTGIFVSPINDIGAVFDIDITNNGQISYDAATARGIDVSLPSSSRADIDITNTGIIELIEATGENGASAGIRISTGSTGTQRQIANVNNSGAIAVADGVGILVTARQANIINSGVITANQTGIVLLGALAPHTITNSGTVGSRAEFAGILVQAPGGTTITNSEDGNIVGARGIVESAATDGDLRIENAGLIAGSGQAGDVGVAIEIAGEGELRLTNTGRISSQQSPDNTDVGIAVLATDTTGDIDIDNRTGGEIRGDIRTGAGDDSISLRSGSMLVGDIATGAGDDSVGVLLLSSTADGDGLATFGTVDLGSGDDRFALASADFSQFVLNAGDGMDTFALGSLGGDNNVAVALDLNPDTFTGFERFVNTSGGRYVVAQDGSQFQSALLRNGSYVFNADLASLTVDSLEITIGGTGTIGDLSLDRFGSLRPGDIDADGNSLIGTLTTGDVIIDGLGSDNRVFYDVQVNDQGQSDRLNVTGTVTLENVGLRVFDSAGGAFNSNDPFTYLIIDNDGTDAIGGTFTSIQNELAFLTPTVSYTGGDGNDVMLTLLRNNVGGGGTGGGNSGGDGGTLGCSPSAANGVTAICRGLVSNQDDPNGYGNGENNVTLTIAENATLQGSQSGVSLGNAAIITVEQNATVEGGFVGNGSPNLATPNGHGIRLRDGSVRVDGTVIASALNGDGIRSDAGPVEILIPLSGRIETAGDFGNGIEIFYDQTTQAIGSVTVDGTIQTVGEQAHGIRAIYLAGNAGNAGTVTASGTISASGTNADGIRAELSNNTGVVVTLREGARVFATNANSSGWGIYLASYEPQTGGTATATINIEEGASVSANTKAAVAEGSQSTNPTTIITDLTLGGEVTVGASDRMAIALDSGDDTLRLLGTYAITGITDLGIGNDTLVLGAGSRADESVARINFDQQTFRNFERLEKLATNSWLLEGTNQDAFDIVVGDGTLRMFANLANSDAMITGGELAGSGNLGDVIVQGGVLGAFDRDDLTGTLTVDSLTLTDQGTLSVLLFDTGEASQIVATQAVTLGNSTVSIEARGNFEGADPFNYTIIDNQSDSAVNGVFGTINLPNFAFLDPSFAYDAGDGNDVVLTLQRNDIVQPPTGPLFPMAANTFNQRNAAMGLDKFDETAGTDTADVFNTILFLTNDEAPLAFDATSGEIYASLLSGQFEQASLRSSRLIARATELGVEGWSMWIDGAIGSGSLDGDGNAASVDADRIGGGIGIDYRGEGNRWALGANVNYSDQELTIPSRNSSATGESWSIGGYARFGTGGAGFTAIGAVSYENAASDVTRGIQIADLNRSVLGNSDLDSLALEATARYGINLGGGWSAGPIATVAYSEANIDPLSERGAQSLNLVIDRASVHRTKAGGGLFANWQKQDSTFDLAARYLAGSDRLAEIGFAFEGNADTALRVRAPRMDGSALVMDANGSIGVGGGWHLGGAIQSAFGKDLDWVSANITVSFTF